MRRYEESSFEVEYSEDDLEFIESSKKPKRFIGILFIALGLIGTTVAANITINNGRIEMGQGIYRISACDQWVGIGLYPTAATYDGKSRVRTVELVGLDPRLCKNVIFRIKMFKNSSPNTPLELFYGTTGTDSTTATATLGNVNQLSIYDSATVSYPSPVASYNSYAAKALTLVNQAGANVSYADAYHRISYVSATGVYRIYLEQPLCLMEDIDKITIESATLTG
jgi:hypothetical protein